MSRCAQCGEPFERGPPNQLYCSRQCKGRAAGIRHSPAAAEKRHARRAAKMAAKRCPHCDGPVVDVIKASARFCSARCRRAARYLRTRDRHKAYRDRVRSQPEFREINRGYAHRRRARQAAAQLADITPEQVEQRMSMFAGCWMCGGEWVEIEHVKPLVRGGPHILANLRPACGPCNRRKGAHWPGVARLYTLTTTKEAA